MNLQDYEFKYKRNLPHIQPENATLFVTFRLHGSIPKQVLQEWQVLKQQKEQELKSIEDRVEFKMKLYEEWKRQFGRIDQYLDTTDTGPKWLDNPQVAQVVQDSLHYFDDRKYRLDAFCIRANHVHLVFAPKESGNGIYYPLKSIMRSIKSYTGNEANKILDRVGKTFW